MSCLVLTNGNVNLGNVKTRTKNICDKAFWELFLISHLHHKKRVINLLQRGGLRRGTAEYGHAFEHLIVQEMMAYMDYTESKQGLSFWHTRNNAYEVDLVVGNAELALEIKSSDNITTSHLKGLKAFGEEHPDCKLIVVSLEERPRMMNGVEIWPARTFLQRLWNGKIVVPHL